VSAMAGAQPAFAAARQWPAGDGVSLRPITPDDAEVLQAYVRGLSAESRYNRFFGALQELPPAELAHVTHLDRKYDVALLAEVNIAGASLVIGEARHAFAPDRLECEFALSVADGWRRRGIGTLLVADMERRARSLGARRLAADALRSNDAMKALAHRAGFRMTDVPFDARLVRIVKELAPAQTAPRPGPVGHPTLPLAA
jgi:GNAT superfamily N-acetyltransferase